MALSTYLEAEGCLKALDKALNAGYKPAIINSDQGSQFTSDAWVKRLRLEDIKVSMDCKGRCLDNIPIERFWWSLKYEEVYPKTYDTVKEARNSITDYIHFYNTKRLHSALGYKSAYDAMIGLYEARIWAFKKPDGNVENATTFTHSSTRTTTSNHFFIKKENLEMVSLP